jgi:TolA-binding protein
LLGESHYGIKQYAKAIEYFIKVLESPEFSDKENAKVMIAESQIRNGETNSAKQTFKQLIADYPESKFVPRARKMLQKL